MLKLILMVPREEGWQMKEGILIHNSKILNKELTFEEFERKIRKNKKEKFKYDGVYYRGQADCSWPLTTSLSRKIPNIDIYTDMYIQVARECTQELGFETSNILIPDILQVGLLSPPGAEGTHKMKQLFSTLVGLRHMGCPSPILDMTLNPYVATFFATNSLYKKPYAIFCIKKKKPFNHSIDRFSPMLNVLAHSAIEHSHARHTRQNSVYLLSIYNNSKEYFTDILKPLFHLSPTEPDDIFSIEKYIIVDHKKRQEVISKKLDALKITEATLFGEKHPCEDGQLEELFLKKFNAHMNGSPEITKTLLVPGSGIEPLTY